uniref:Uncharacterized protein n=2 Tax=Cacopsylla melanoneura TaxID=428564 RepID=A0A8D8T1W1_9HEMI
MPRPTQVQSAAVSVPSHLNSIGRHFPTFTRGPRVSTHMMVRDLVMPRVMPPVRTFPNFNFNLVRIVYNIFHLIPFHDIISSSRRTSSTKHELVAIEISFVTSLRWWLSTTVATVHIRIWSSARFWVFATISRRRFPTMAAI